MLNKNILITGGAGYIGSNLSNYLNKKKNKIFVIDDLSSGKKERQSWNNTDVANNLNGAALKINTTNA